MKFGDRVRQKRTELRMTIRGLAKKAGISAAFLCELEHSTRGCSIETASKLASALGVQTAWLIGESPQRRRVQLGVIEFHSERVNPGLIKRFYEVRDDLTRAGCIVDLWLLDIAKVLREFGYEMEIYKTSPEVR